MWDPEEKKKWIEWNLQKDFCRKKRLIWKAYPADREHDHCEFCWAKFWADPQADEGCLKAGFVIEGTDCWWSTFPKSNGPRRAGFSRRGPFLCDDVWIHACYRASSTAFRTSFMSTMGSKRR